MNQKILIFLLTLIASQLGIAQGQASQGGYCDCQSILCATRKQCSVKGYSCTCTCTLTICTCTPCSQSERPTVDEVDVTTIHIQNRAELTGLLRSFNTDAGENSAKLIEETFSALSKERDYDKYITKANLAEQAIGNLPQQNKDAVNAWIASKGSSVRY